MRIVVAIAAPLDGEPKLDYESELRNIVTSVREAKAGGAEVRIVTFATTAEIKKALDAGDVHVLHISCHGSAGRLVLENENDRARLVDARTLIEEAIPPGKMPPVICLLENLGFLCCFTFRAVLAIIPPIFQRVKIGRAHV